jgi:hypothetical protein
MPSRRGIFRLFQRDITDIDRLRELVRTTADILKRFPTPDTFIGRKTQEPFPMETRLSGESHRRSSRASSARDKQS